MLASKETAQQSPKCDAPHSGKQQLAGTDHDPIVSVVIPAFNAARTIQETLHSVSQQTYRALDIIVVDDGSTDETAALVRDHARTDSRLRLVQKPNGGIASARNEGIRTSIGAFVAFIDADDLWHSTKIRKQIDVMLRASADTALVYAPCRVIDIEGRVTDSLRRRGVNGWVLHRHFRINIVGNGSSILVRRSVLDEVGGFDPSLRQAGAEGCEDLLLQLRIAARYRFGEVSEYLVGYRRWAGGMSADREQMARSGTLAVRKAFAECGDVPNLSADEMLRRYEWQRVRAALQQGDVSRGLSHLWRQFKASPIFVLTVLWDDLMICGFRTGRAAWDAVSGQLRLGPSKRRRHFYDFDPQTDIPIARSGVTPPRSLRRLAALDETYRPKVTERPRGSPDVTCGQPAGPPAHGNMPPTAPDKTRT